MCTQLDTISHPVWTVTRNQALGSGRPVHLLRRPVALFLEIFRRCAAITMAHRTDACAEQRKEAAPLLLNDIDLSPPDRVRTTVPGQQLPPYRHMSGKSSATHMSFSLGKGSPGTPDDAAWPAMVNPPLLAFQGSCPLSSVRDAQGSTAMHRAATVLGCAQPTEDVLHTMDWSYRADEVDRLPWARSLQSSDFDMPLLERTSTFLEIDPLHTRATHQMSQGATRADYGREVHALAKRGPSSQGLFGKGLLGHPTVNLNLEGAAEPAVNRTGVVGETNVAACQSGPVDMDDVEEDGPAAADKLSEDHCPSGKLSEGSEAHESCKRRVGFIISAFWKHIVGF